jgi:hypothetical protein
LAKRGRRPAPLETLLVFELEWYKIFDGLRNGIDQQYATYSVPRIEPPKLLRFPYEGLNEERVKEWIRKQQEPTDLIEQRRRHRIPDERHLWERLKKARSARQIRAIYEKSEIWFRRSGRPWLRDIYNHADEFIGAKGDSRYPKSNRPSSDGKRVEYFARVMAGITLRIPPATAIDKLRKVKHDSKCNCWRCFSKHMKAVSEQREFQEYLKKV